MTKKREGTLEFFFEETIHQLKTIFYYSFCFIMLKKNTKLLHNFAFAIYVVKSKKENSEMGAPIFFCNENKLFIK